MNPTRQSEPAHASTEDLPIEASQRADAIAAEIRSDAMTQATERQAGGADGEGRHHASELDDEWGSFVRTDLVPARYVRETLQGVDIRLLYRNTILNPQDRHIPATLRLLLQTAVSPLLDGLARAGEAEGLTAAKELAFLVQSGRSESMSLQGRTLGGLLSHEEAEQLDKAREHVRAVMARRKGVSVSSVPKASIGDLVVPDLMFKNRPVPFVFKIEDGRLHSADLHQLPGTRTLIEAKEFLGGELLRTICAWFVGVGAVDAKTMQCQIDEYWRSGK